MENKSGFIYILWNKIYNYYGENVYKIGKTSNIVCRLNQYTTSYIDPCEIKYLSRRCINYTLAEGTIFQLIHNKRIISNREFFKIDKDEAIKIIDEVINKINNGIITELIKEPIEHINKINNRYKILLFKQFKATYNIDFYQSYITTDDAFITLDENLYTEIKKYYRMERIKPANYGEILKMFIIMLRNLLKQQLSADDIMNNYIYKYRIRKAKNRGYVKYSFNVDNIEDYLFTLKNIY